MNHHISILSIQSIPLRQSLTLRSIYSGLAPSTNHPSQFEGCIKDMTVEDEILHPVAKGKVLPPFPPPPSISSSLQTRSGCTAPNRCSIEGVCPPNSHCHREWERHSCKCQSGFFGDSCRSVCSLKGICGEGGICQPTNTTRGYECECPSSQFPLFSFPSISFSSQIDGVSIVNSHVLFDFVLRDGLVHSLIVNNVIAIHRRDSFHSVINWMANVLAPWVISIFITNIYNILSSERSLSLSWSLSLLWLCSFFSFFFLFFFWPMRMCRRCKRREVSRSITKSNSSTSL